MGRGFLRALPWIGAGVAGAEVGYLSSNHEFLKSANLLPEEASVMLTTLYAGHIVQAGIDPTLFGGEFGTRAIADHLQETYDIDPVTMGMIKPGLVIDLLSGNDLNIEEYNRVVEMFAEDRLLEMYSSVAEAHGLPQTVTVNINGEEQDISIGIAMRDPDLAALIARNYVDDNFAQIEIPEDASREVERALRLINQANALQLEIRNAEPGTGPMAMTGMEMRRNQAVGEKNYYLNRLSEEDLAIVEELSQPNDAALRGLDYIRSLNTMAAVARGMEIDGADRQANLIDQREFTTIEEGLNALTDTEIANAPEEVKELLTHLRTVYASEETYASLQANFYNASNLAEANAAEAQRDAAESAFNAYYEELEASGKMEDVHAYLTSPDATPTLLADADEITGQGERNEEIASVEADLRPGTPEL